MVTTFSWRQPRSWTLVLLCLLLTGCATRVIYYLRDSAIVWQLDYSRAVRHLLSFQINVRKVDSRGAVFVLSDLRILIQLIHLFSLLRISS